MPRFLSAVGRWVETAGELLAAQTHIPLIDNEEIDMGEELYAARERGDDAVRSAIDNVLSRDPDDLAARFVALNAYLPDVGEPDR